MLLVTASSKAVLFGRPGPLQILQPELALLDDRLKIELATHAIQTASPPDIALVSMRNGTSDATTEDKDLQGGSSPDELHPYRLLGLHKRTNRDCGVFRMDCAYVGSACNNACFYQNCVKQDSTIRYEDGGGSKRFQWKSDQNRVDAGTTTNPSSPCRMLPLSQRTWDQWPNWEQDDPDLEMDEWPVAAMEQPEFSTLGQGTIRNSLRCITAGDNSRAGNLYKYFRQGQVQYSSTKGGKYTHLRLCKGELKAGDSFTVDFDLSEMSDTEIDEIVPYCKPNPDCTNDGQQFHLSDLVYVTDAGKAGRMGWPYDIARMNNYMVTGEDDPVEAFQVVVDVYGDERDMFAATVSKYRDTSYEEAGSVGTHELLIDQSITVSGLPRDLTITRRSDSDADWLEFVYGDPVNELAGFAFNSNDAGYSSQFDTSPDVHRYCLMTDLEDNDGDVFGQQYTCWFSAW
ncbi:hypothetical protein D6D29_06216 [Aureobasidium pullulans]|nr:hypothetical protein D6D29_06216 [Aureobasidium pullulans]